MQHLDLYADVEDLLGIEEATEELHHYFLSIINELKPQTLLDVGCGDGALVAKAKSLGIASVGIDLSEKQIAKAQAKGLAVAQRDIAETIGEYECITIVFDVINFIPPAELEAFFTHIKRLLKVGGTCILDCNTQFGFEMVAQGTMTNEDDTRTVVIDALFENNQLMTDITLFTHFDKECFHKHKERITQYYHPIIDIIEASGLEINVEMPIELYGDEPDKSILVLKKEVV